MRALWSGTEPRGIDRTGFHRGVVEGGLTR